MQGLETLDIVTGTQGTRPATCKEQAPNAYPVA